MPWVEIEVNFSDLKHMVELTWCVDEVDNTIAVDFHDIWWFWCHFQSPSSGIDRRLVCRGLAQRSCVDVTCLGALTQQLARD